MPPRGRYYMEREVLSDGREKRRKTRRFLVLCSHKFTTLALPVSIALYYLIIFVPLLLHYSICVSAFVINMTYFCLLPLFDDFLFLSVSTNHSLFVCHCLVYTNCCSRSLLSFNFLRLFIFLNPVTLFNNSSLIPEWHLLSLLTPEEKQLIKNKMHCHRFVT